MTERPPLATTQHAPPGYESHEAHGAGAQRRDDGRESRDGAGLDQGEEVPVYQGSAAAYAVDKGKQPEDARGGAEEQVPVYQGRGAYAVDKKRPDGGGEHEEVPVYQGSAAAYAADKGEDDDGHSGVMKPAGNDLEGTVGFQSQGDQMDTVAAVGDDGEINVWLDVKARMPALEAVGKGGVDTDKDLPSLPEFAVDPQGGGDCPPLNVVIFVVGSRGDVQPYLALALRLIQTNGHRVRIATHTPFEALVLGGNELLKGQSDARGPLEGRLEFFDIGGDPKELMAYMVKNPGLLPGFASLTNGDVLSKRKMTKEMLTGFYHACFHPDTKTGAGFAADAIISNPPAFAHIHVAEALGLPLLMSFTMPWSPTGRFAHPLVNVQTSNAEEGMTNFLSYAMADTLIWQGLADVINTFRTETLGISPLDMLTGPMTVERQQIPFTYAWSTSLLPKPREWKEHIDIVGFFTIPTTVHYTPDPALAAFLAAGPPPVYIGFGSIVVKDPDALTKIILEAIEMTGIRALVSAGWSDLGSVEMPDNVFLIKGDIPHDWLFAQGRVAAVCHHGGAGTTSAGLSAGLPTIIIPFFGDQKFWGTAVALAGAGPDPIPYKKLTAPKLAAALEFALSPGTSGAAQEIGERIRSEDGTLRGVESFHAHLPLEHMRCDLGPGAALWWSQKHCLRLSAEAAGVLVDQGVLKWKELTPNRAKEYETGRNYADPISAGAIAMLDVLAGSTSGAAQLFYAPSKGAVKLSWGILKASGKVFSTMHEGMENLPGMMGSRTRQRGRVDGIASGVTEAVKGLGYGVMDGVTGLVTEPWDGYEKQGPVGAAVGVGKGLLNMFVRPGAGIFGLIANPAAGAYYTIRDRLEADKHPLRFPRMEASMAAAMAVEPKDRAFYVSQFRTLTAGNLARARHKQLKLRRREANLQLLPAEERELALAQMRRGWTGHLLPPPRHNSGNSRPGSTASSRRNSASVSPQISPSLSPTSPARAQSMSASSPPGTHHTYPRTHDGRLVPPPRHESYGSLSTASTPPTHSRSASLASSPVQSPHLAMSEMRLTDSPEGVARPPLPPRRENSKASSIPSPGAGAGQGQGQQ